MASSSACSSPDRRCSPERRCSDACDDEAVPAAGDTISPCLSKICGRSEAPDSPVQTDDTGVSASACSGGDTLPPEFWLHDQTTNPLQDRINEVECYNLTLDGPGGPFRTRDSRFETLNDMYDRMGQFPPGANILLGRTMLNTPSDLNNGAKLTGAMVAPNDDTKTSSQERRSTLPMEFAGPPVMPNTTTIDTAAEREMQMPGPADQEAPREAYPCTTGRARTQPSPIVTSFNSSDSSTNTGSYTGQSIQESNSNDGQGYGANLGSSSFGHQPYPVSPKRASPSSPPDTLRSSSGYLTDVNSPQPGNASSTQLKKEFCKRGHPLREIKSCSIICCLKCSRKFPDGTTLHACNKCLNYVVCKPCLANPEEQEERQVGLKTRVPAADSSLPQESKFRGMCQIEAPPRSPDHAGETSPPNGDLSKTMVDRART